MEVKHAQLDRVSFAAPAHESELHVPLTFQRLLHVPPRAPSRTPALCELNFNSEVVPRCVRMTGSAKHYLR